MEAFEWVLVGFSAITTILITWQIYTIISIHKIVKSRLDKEIPKIKGEAIGTCLFNLAASAVRSGDEVFSLCTFIKAAWNLNSTEQFDEEIEACLDNIERLIKEIQTQNAFITFEGQEGIEFAVMLHSLRSHRAKHLALKFQRILQVPQQK